MGKGFLSVVFALFVLCCPLRVSAQIPQLWVDHEYLYADDVMTVYIKLPEGAKNTPVDVSPFYAHFNVISFNRVANNRKYDYTVKMVPKKFGMTALPPLNIGGHKTSRIFIKRYELSLKNNKSKIFRSDAPDIFVKVKALDYNMYMYGKGKIQVSLYDGVGIHNGNVDNPQVKGAVVTMLSQNPDRIEEYNERSYLVKSWDYQVEFKKPMPVYVVDPVRFMGEVNGPVIEGRPNFYAADPFLGVKFGPPHNLTVYSEVISLPVKNVPRNTFPAKRVVVQEKYEEPAELKVNASVKRNIVIYAVGGSLDIEPVIDSRENPVFYTVYPSGIAKRMIKYKGEPAVEITTSFVYVFNHEGQVDIPQIVFNWFNAENGIIESEHFDKRTFYVAPDDSANAAKNAAAIARYSSPQPQPVSPVGGVVSIPSTISGRMFPGSNSYGGQGITLVNNIASQLAAASPAANAGNSLPVPANQPVPSAVSQTSVSDAADSGSGNDIISIFGIEILQKTLVQIVSVILLLSFLIAAHLRGGQVKNAGRTRRKSPKNKTTGHASKSNALDAFYNAARLGNAKDAEANLIKFADEVDVEGAPHNLAKVGMLFGGNHDLMTEIELLNRELYSGDNGTWNGSRLITLVRKFYKIVELKTNAKHEKEAKKDESLPSLYMN